jgi:hypothetical protein
MPWDTGTHPPRTCTSANAQRESIVVEHPGDNGGDVVDLPVDPWLGVSEQRTLVTRPGARSLTERSRPEESTPERTLARPDACRRAGCAAGGGYRAIRTPDIEELRPRTAYHHADALPWLDDGSPQP